MFNFQDFMLYTGVDASNEMKYATIASGVLSYVEETYGIYLAPVQKDIVLFSDKTKTLTLGVTPVNTINSVKQDTLDVAYTYYGRGLLLTGTFDINIPLVVNMSVGFTDVPSDLKLAIYTHIQAMYYSIDNHIANVSKTVNSEGNTTFYKDLAIPLESVLVYDRYSKRQLVLI